MISWKLWQALRYPVYDHPLFHRTLAAYGRKAQILKSRYSSEQVIRILPKDVAAPNPGSHLTIKALLIYLGGGVFFLCGGWFIALLLILALIPYAGTLYGLEIATRISALIAREHENGMYDFVRLSPQGGLGLCWAITSAFLYRNQSFRRWKQWARLIYGGLSIIVGFAMLILAFEVWGGLNTPTLQGRVMAEGALDSLVFCVLILLLIAALYIDLVHSTITGVVAAMLTGVYARNRLEARFLALAGFLAVQLTTYLIVLSYVSTFSRLPTNTAYRIVPSAIGLLLFFAIREALIYLLWRATLHRLQVLPDEWDNLGVKFAKERVV